MISRLINNSNKILNNSNKYFLYNSSIANKSINPIIINSYYYNNNNINRSFVSSSKSTKPSQQQQNENENTLKFDQNKEPFELIYEAMIKKIEETEKALNDDIKPIISKKTKTQIILSRHGSLTFLLFCFTFLGTMIYFYFQKRKHILLTNQVEHHHISTVSDVEKLKIDLDKLNQTLSIQSNQNQLVDLLIAEIIESNQEAMSKLTSKDIQMLKLKLRSLIQNYQLDQKQQQQQQQQQKNDQPKQ